LENANIAFRSSHPHYAFIPEGMQRIVRDAYSNRSWTVIRLAKLRAPLPERAGGQFGR
jgi:hypothetical protein